jgi:hypothetical protein
VKNQFFEKPILNAPYKYPERYWELDTSGQPTQKIIEKRRPAEFITPIPKPKKQKGAQQESLLFDETLSTQAQQYHSAIINCAESSRQAKPRPVSCGFHVPAHTRRMGAYEVTNCDLIPTQAHCRTLRIH